MSRAPTVPLAAPSFIGCAGAGAEGPGDGVGVRIDPLMPGGRLDRPEGVGGKAECSPGTPAPIDKGETEAIDGLGKAAGWLGAAAAASATAGAGAAGEDGGVFERAEPEPDSAGVIAVAAGAGAAGASSLAPHPRQNL